jgi:alpha-tubulin suppressor-like RCC1 family protein
MGMFGHESNLLYVPTLVEGLRGKPIKDISFGFDFFIALTEDGKVYSWGGNECGQLGHKSDVEMNPIPKQIEAFSTYKVKSISAGLFFACALLDNGKVS